MIDMFDNLERQHQVLKDVEIFADDELGGVSQVRDKHFSIEFSECAPKSEEELLDFYKRSYNYLWANAQHVYSRDIDHWPQGRYLDFGGGAGNWSIPLLETGCAVDYLDINKLQIKFMKWIKDRYDYRLLNIVEQPFDEYDGIILRDVIEHLKDYTKVLTPLFTEHLKVGGLVYAKPEFTGETGEWSIHYHDHFNYEHFMKGCGLEKTENPLEWRKVR
jgi:hypothetical protein